MANAFTVYGGGPLLELTTQVGLTKPYEPRPLQLSFVGVWDTGATGCAITKDVADAIGVKPCGIANVAGVHGTQPVNTYFIALHLPTGNTIPLLEATELDPSAGCDFLIGMDVICMGDFAISNVGGQTVFTYRSPSQEVFDFTKPCGRQP